MIEIMESDVIDINGNLKKGHNVGILKGSVNKKLNVVIEKFQLLLDSVRYVIQTKLMVRKVRKYGMRIF